MATGTEQCCHTNTKQNQTVHTCALLCNVKADSEEVIMGDDIVRALSPFSDKTDLLGASYTTFWTRLLPISSHQPICYMVEAATVPQACWYSCTRPHGITSLESLFYMVSWLETEFISRWFSAMPLI